MPDYPNVAKLESVTVLLPVINETVSLKQTVEIVLRDARADILELLIIVCKKTTPESMAVISQLQKELGGLVVVLHQTRPFLGGAFRDAFEVSRGSHLLMMSTDLETDPKDAGALIEAAKKNPSGVVTTSRWLGGSAFSGYSRIKLVCNWLFQHFFSLLYGTHLTDMTFGYRIFPAKLVQAIQWEELRHPFLLETMVKPLRLGVPVTEIPTDWHARIEGESQNPFFRNFVYFRTGLKTRFLSRQSILKASRPSAA
jgi:glycosyltransferase involved in cell wall biosynthesis